MNETEKHEEHPWSETEAEDDGAARRPFYLALAAGLLLVAAALPLTRRAKDAFPTARKAIDAISLRQPMRSRVLDDVKSAPSFVARDNRSTRRGKSISDFKPPTGRRAPMDDRGLVAMTLEPVSESRWRTEDRPKVIYEIDDEEWGSYELSASHPSESTSCLQCHTRDELP